MKIRAKVTSYTTNKVCCKQHKSLIEITMVECVLGESYSAQCSDCGNTIEGYRNVKNLLVTTNPLLTPFLLNKANQN
jgi:hypothetical protein